ncbi:fungal-specific transcription factor domain-containing protein [Hypoxylon crocopeplum]|nr:fungal-specific transcription factor domain-containing protein [Hypoxylon crocopeplum]
MVSLRACHNCRGRRLRCDRSVPTCYKCTSTGQECLGYGKLYKWVDNVTSRGRTTTESFAQPTSKTREHAKSHLDLNPTLTTEDIGISSRIPTSSLLDPLFQDLNPSSRRYLNYYAVRFCQDLIIYDSPQRGANPFRELVPMSHEYPFLREIIIASSAMHFANTARWQRNPRPAVDALVDAFHARHRAIKSLQTVIQQQRPPEEGEVGHAERDAVLAAVLFFVNFALIDSGRGGWRAHMNFVGTLLSMRTSNSLQPGCSSILTQGFGPDMGLSSDVTTIGPLISLAFARSPVSPTRSLGVRDYITSDSMAYYIWSNALDSLVSSGTKDSPPPLSFDGDNAEILHILLRTEANSYHSCPSRLLQVIFRTSQLARDIRSNNTGLLNDQQMQSCLDLLGEIREFDGDTWAADVCAKIASTVGYVDEVELEYRKHIAATFRAAVSLYVLLVAPELPSQVLQRASSNNIGEDNSPTLPSAADLATEILARLSFIPTDSPIFKFATWPIFLTGVETADPARRAWVLDLLHDMRDLCPWGMLTSAMETLIEIWRMRDGVPIIGGHETNGGVLPGVPPTSQSTMDSSSNWLIQLHGFKIDCLIV